MKLEEISISEYDSYARRHPLKSFFQTSKMGNSAKLRGIQSYYIGVKKNDKLIGACRLEAVKNRIGKNYFYAPRGPLLDYNDLEVLEFFTKNIKKYIKKKNGYQLHIDPLIMHKQRDIEGNIIEGGIDNTKIIDNLKSLGYIHCGFNTDYEYDKQVRWVFCLDLNKSEKEIFSNMKQNHRNIIKKTEKFGIKIKELAYDELADYKKITEDTSERRNFNDKSLEYYQTMYNSFKDQVKFIVAYINVDEYIASLKSELVIQQNKLDKSLKIDKSSGKVKELNITIDSLNKRIKEATEMLKEGSIIPLSAAMFMLYEGEITYLFSGSYQKYMKFYAQYAIQWYMIKHGIENNYIKYNFYGIKGNFDKNDPEYGVYEFKKGFNGYVEEYIGDFDLPITWFYNFKKTIKK